jgi:hypothetical protein
VNESWVPPEPTDESLARMGHNFDAEYDDHLLPSRPANETWFVEYEETVEGGPDGTEDYPEYGISNHQDPYEPPYDYINDPLGMLHD